jgi:hypothetical protein
MMEGTLAQAGRIVGGWEYIWASYIITWLGVVLYAASLYWRRRKANTNS